MQDLTRKRKASSPAVAPTSIKSAPSKADSFILPMASASLGTLADLDPYSIATTQTRHSLTTQTLTASEDAVYSSAFNSRSPLNDHNRHPVTVSLLGTSPPIALNLPDFGARLDECSSVPFNFSSVSSFVSGLISDMGVPVGLTPESLHWYVYQESKYISFKFCRSMVGAVCLIHASSSVHVTKLNLGTTQLGVKAERFIKDGSEIPELYGMMGSDVDNKRTKLSEIVKHPTNTGPDGVRLLAGPMRLANHHCHPNCEVRLFASEINIMFSDALVGCSS